MNHEEFMYIILYVDNMKTYKSNNNYLNKINKQLNNKYTISDATNSNLYLKMEVINNKQGDILLIQQQKIKDRLKKLRLKDYNTVKTPIKDYLQPPLEEQQVTSDDKT